ncbi:hypothetical protein GGR58DRAFT_237562 [Xylaria digitata]|nr:hypothetical protein GGR58DRAFT_237562 [Xylaria digitata]
MPQPKSQHRSSARAPLSSEHRIQPQQHSRFSSSSSSQAIWSLSDAKTRSTSVPCSHGPRSLPRPREASSLVQHSRAQRENIKHTTRELSAGSQGRLHRPSSAPSNQQQAFPGLRTRDILTNRRLQQVTGFLPRKVDLWDDREIPPDELDRLEWAMTLPEPFPTKRPRGELLTPIALRVKKT